MFINNRIRIAFTHKRSVFIAGLLFLLPLSADAQPWSYDFGSAVGVHSTGASTTFLPLPSSGTGRVRVGTQGGAFQFANPGDSALGGASELLADAATGLSLNKFQLFDFTGGSTGTIRFSCVFDTAGGGDWYWFCGNGSCFSGNGGFITSQVFTGLKWSLTSGGTISSYYRDGSTWTALSGSPFAQDSVYTVDIYSNNSGSSVSYTYNGTRSLSANCFDLWVNGNLVGDDLAKAGLPDTTGIDSFMFYGASSPGNASRLRIDDIVYSNQIANAPLPVELQSIHGYLVGSTATLKWLTATESNNFGFEIQRGAIAEEDTIWDYAGFTSGRGHSNVPATYTFEEKLTPELLSASVLHYRLKQIDRDGSFELTAPVRIMVGSSNDISDLQVYPNPFSTSTSISFKTGEPGPASLHIYDLLGRRVATLLKREFLPTGYHSIRLNMPASPQKTFICILESADGSSKCRILRM